ncbi:MAG: GNAT family N-acetyltransferase [Thermoplasmata archaeon]
MTSVRLTPLSHEGFEEYITSEIREYALSHVRDGRWSESEALERSEREVRGLIPQGLETPDHYFFRIENDHGNDVGRVWLARRHEEGVPYAFVYDLVIFPDHRRQGYGEAAMLELEPIARGLEVARVALHVFGDNANAIRLYEKLGYATTNRMMSKPLE